MKNLFYLVIVSLLFAACTKDPGVNSEQLNHRRTVGLVLDLFQTRNLLTQEAVVFRICCILVHGSC